MEKERQRAKEKDKKARRKKVEAEARLLKKKAQDEEEDLQRMLEKVKGKQLSVTALKKEAERAIDSISKDSINDSSQDS